MSTRIISKKMISALIAGFGIAALSVSAASAATIIFQDQFNRPDSSTVGNGWSERDRHLDDVAIDSNKLQLRDDVQDTFRDQEPPYLPDAAAASSTISSMGFNNISVEFLWTGSEGGLKAIESTDSLHLAWALAPSPAITDEGAWTSAGTFNAAGGTWFTENVALGAAAANTMFNIMFWTEVSHFEEAYYIDYVVVSGDAILSTPLPAALPSSALALAYSAS